MKKTLGILMALSVSMAPAARALAKGDLATDTFPDAQAQVKRRLDEIWAVCAKKDFAKLASFHMYGPKFTEFKDGEPRGDAAANRKTEETQLGMMADPKVDMKDLAVNVYGDTAIANLQRRLLGQGARNGNRRENADHDGLREVQGGLEDRPRTLLADRAAAGHATRRSTEVDGPRRSAQPAHRRQHGGSAAT
jgi:hypothetical protein